MNAPNTQPVFPLRLSRRDVLAGVGILLLAFGLRVMVVFDRAQADPFFDPLPPGTDQRVYVELAARYEAGSWPDGPFFWQPGIVYFLVGARALVGESLGMMRLVMALAGALACGWMAGAGWLLTRRRWGGYLAGLLLAVYPVAIFFATDFLTEGLASVYISLFLFLALWQREQPARWRSALVGVVLGLTIITRTNLGVLAPAWLALLALSLPRRQALFHAALSLVFLALAIAPVTLYNRQAARGQPYPLVTSTGLNEVYRANNRDATGVRSTDPAMLTVDGDYLDALLADIRLKPLRFVELQIRKTGLYWSELEPGNNLDYLQSGEAVSPLLRAVPLDFRTLAFFGWLGVVAMFYQNRRLGLFFALLHLLIFAGVMPLWAEGRLKQPAVAPLVAASAYAAVALYDLARARRWRDLARRYAPPALALLLALAGLRAAVDVLPQTRPVAGLPDDLRPLGVTWDGALRLIGWRTLPDWPAAERGWTHFQRSYVVQLYWEVLNPVEVDYNFYLAYIVDGQRIAGFDHPVGAVSFMPRRTSAWQPGEIYAEILGFKLPQDAPREISGDIRLGVYRLEGEDESSRMVIPVQAAPANADAITLQRLAVFDMGGQAAVEGFAVFGGQLSLHGLELPPQAEPGESLSLIFYWTALADLQTDYTLFIHLLDENGRTAAQYDGQPRQNRLPTSTWPPDYTVRDEVQLMMPDRPGVYPVYMGWYDARSFDRLPVDGSPDGRLLLGEIRVES
ncbi:MAG: glycosyltransferase family 39 protein [Chloroflexi bacterium]|nr:glycosyltransferase family 39 protein [Chloroflexota bacterium]